MTDDAAGCESGRLAAAAASPLGRYGVGRGILGVKNSLTAADARIVEHAFQSIIASIGGGDLELIAAPPSLANPGRPQLAKRRQRQPMSPFPIVSADSARVSKSGRMLRSTSRPLGLLWVQTHSVARGADDANDGALSCSSRRMNSQSSASDRRACPYALDTP
jgi:hypothetical protein